MPGRPHPPLDSHCPQSHLQTGQHPPRLTQQLPLTKGSLRLLAGVTAHSAPGAQQDGERGAPRGSRRESGQGGQPGSLCGRNQRTGGQTHGRAGSSLSGRPSLSTPARKPTQGRQHTSPTCGLKWPSVAHPIPNLRALTRDYQDQQEQS